MSEVTLFDAQATFRNIVRPFPNFETTYQGFGPDVPIAFPGTLDPAAGRPGYDPNLIAGLPVPFGATIWLWIPLCVAGRTEEGGANISLYDYTIVWRLRNLTDFKDRRAPFHIEREFPGAVDNAASPPQGRFVVPAARQVIKLQQPETFVTPTDPELVNLRNLLWTPRGGGTVEPLIPGMPPKSATIQQGVLDPAIDPTIAKDPLFNAYSFQCQGDEMIILATKRNKNDWDFTDPAEDLPFSNVYGNGNGMHAPFDQLGIYYLTGATPAGDDSV